MSQTHCPYKYARFESSSWISGLHMSKMSTYQGSNANQKLPAIDQNEKTKTKDIPLMRLIKSSPKQSREDLHETAAVTRPKDRYISATSSRKNGARDIDDDERDSFSEVPHGIRTLDQDTNMKVHRRDERQDSGYDDQDLKVNVEMQVRNIRARQRVEVLRGRVWKTRRVTNESRQHVQELRTKLSDATSKLMKAVDLLMASGEVTELKALKPLHQATRSAQDVLGPAEERLDMLELRLNREEDELEEEEMEFYTRNNISLKAPPEQQLDIPLSPLHSPYKPEGSDFEFPNIDNDLMQEYLIKLNAAEDLKEELSYLEDEQFRLTKEREFRTRYNFELSPDSSDFLSNFDESHAILSKQLSKAEADLDSLREQCLDEGIFGEHEYLYEPHNALVAEVMDSVDEVLGRSPLHTAIQNTSHSFQETNFSDKQDYVNKWMLGLLEYSVVEGDRLKAEIFYTYPAQGKDIIGDQWSELAIMHWNDDGAGKQANFLYELNTREISSSSKTSVTSLHNNFGEFFDVTSHSSGFYEDKEESDITERD